MWSFLGRLGRAGVWGALVISLAVLQRPAAADTPHVPSGGVGPKASVPKPLAATVYDSIWTMSGSACQPPGSSPGQVVRLTQRDQTVTATMVYGDSCVSAGGVLWRGTITPGFGATTRTLFMPRMTSGGGTMTSDIVLLQLYNDHGAPIAGMLDINGESDVKLSVGGPSHPRVFTYTPGEPVDAAYRGRLPVVNARQLRADEVAKRYGAANQQGTYQTFTGILLRKPKVLAALHRFLPNFTARCTEGDLTEAVALQHRELLLFANVGACGSEAFAYEPSSEKAALFATGRMQGTPDPEMASALVRYADELQARSNVPASNQPSAATVNPVQGDGPAHLLTVEQGLPMDLPLSTRPREDPKTIDDAIAQQDSDTLQALLQNFLSLHGGSPSPDNTVPNHKLYPQPMSWLGPRTVTSGDHSISIELPAGFSAIARDQYELIVTRVGGEANQAIQLSSFPMERVGSVDMAVTLEEALLTRVTSARGGGYQHRTKELLAIELSPCERVSGVYQSKSGATPGYVRSLFCLKNKKIFNTRLVFTTSVAPPEARGLVSLADSAKFK